MNSFTYLIYILIFEVMIIGGCGYAVFVLGHSGWWFVIAIMLSGSAYKPSEWIHGTTKEPKL